MEQRLFKWSRPKCPVRGPKSGTPHDFQKTTIRGLVPPAMTHL